MNQSNQSFTEFKADKRKLESEIIYFCNNFSEKYGIKIDRIHIRDHSYSVADSAEKILSLKVEVEV